jgi:PTS system nitrogen regulatory IIA component
LAILARISPFRLDLFRPLRKKEHMRIFESLDSHLISFLDADTRDEAIDSLIGLLAKAGKLPDKTLFRNAIFHREKLVSTGIGMGVAVPHAKMKNFPNFFIAIGIQKKKGLDWNALDTAPVRIIFMIGGPEDKQSEYLQILSQLTSAIKNVDLRKSLLKSQSPEQVLRLFSDF